MQREGLDADWSAAALRPAIPLSGTGLVGNSLLISGRVLVVGASFLAVGGPGNVRLLDGMDANGTLIMVAGMAAAGTVLPAFPAAGIRCRQGVYLTQGGVTSLSYVVSVVPLDEIAMREADRLAAVPGKPGQHGA